MLTTLDFGQQVDLLNKDELRDALAEDARLRALVAGVKPVETFIPGQAIGASVAVFSTSGNPPQAPTSGYIWAVMSIGMDLSSSNAVNIYKGTPSAAGSGIGKPVAHLAAATTQAFNFAKGQLWLRPGDQLTMLAAGGAFILSLYLVSIEVPAERVGELLI